MYQIKISKRGSFVIKNFLRGGEEIKRKKRNVFSHFLGASLWGEKQNNF